MLWVLSAAAQAGQCMCCLPEDTFSSFESLATQDCPVKTKDYVDK